MTDAVTPRLQELRSSAAVARLRYHSFRREAHVATMVGLSLGMAALTGLAAQVRIPLPFTPVPITMQTFAVLLAGVVLGARYGGLSQLLYGGLGVAGVPWFQSLGAGLGHLLGPTGGYLVGFVAAAAFVGLVVDRFPVARRLPVLLGVLAVANGLLLYGFGASWLYLWSNLLAGDAVGVRETLAMGVAPFLAGDAVKLVAAAVLGTALLPGASDVVEREASVAGDGEAAAVRR